MKTSTRVKLVVIGVLLAAMFTVGSAWAATTAEGVKTIIDGTGLLATVSGSTITVTGTATVDVNQYGGGYEAWPLQFTGEESYMMLPLGDISGLTVDWNASLTVTGDVNRESASIRVIGCSNGSFMLTGGTIDIQTTGSGRTRVIDATGASSITVDGITMKGPGDGITADGDGSQGITVASGTIDFPNSIAANADAITVSGGTINGLVAYQSGERQIIEARGTANTTFPFDFDEVPATLGYIVKSSATWTVSADIVDLPKATNTFDIEEGGMLILNGDGPLNNYGTVTNKGTVINNSTINNFSGNTIDNQGTWTNNGTINNETTGKITNSGTIDNTNGTIDNEGVLQSNQTADEMGGSVTGNAVAPITNSSGSSGCDAGFGVFTLAALALPLLTRKSRSKF